MTIGARSELKERKARGFLEYCQFMSNIIKEKFSIKPIEPRKRLFLFVSNRIHLKHKSGTYTVKSISKKDSIVTITCHKWQVEKKLGLRSKDYLNVNLSDITCKYGGESIYKEYK